MAEERIANDPFREGIESAAVRIEPRGAMAVVGSRQHSNLVMVERFLRQYLPTLPTMTTIISGGAVGVDQVAARVARDLGFYVEEILPRFNEYPDGEQWHAPLDRKSEIIAAVAAAPGFHRCLAFPDGESSGTVDAIAMAEAAGLRVAVIGLDGKKA